MNPIRAIICAALIIAISTTAYVVWFYDGTAESPVPADDASEPVASPDAGLRITIGAIKVNTPTDIIDPSKVQVFFKCVVAGKEYRIPNDDNYMEFDRDLHVSDAGVPTTMSFERSVTIPVAMGKTYTINLFMKDFDSPTVADTIDLKAYDNLVSGVALKFTAGEVWNNGNYLSVNGSDAPYGSCTIYMETVTL